MTPMSTTTKLATLSLAAALAGCQFGFGPTPATFEPAREPAGINAQLLLDDRRVHGELLEVREDELLLLLTAAPSRVARVPIEGIRLGQFHQVRDRIVRGAFASPEDRERVRRLSRFPAGLPAERLAELLRVHGQEAPEVLR